MVGNDIVYLLWRVLLRFVCGLPGNWSFSADCIVVKVNNSRGNNKTGRGGQLKGTRENPIDEKRIWNVYSQIRDNI